MIECRNAVLIQEHPERPQLDGLGRANICTQARNAIYLVYVYTFDQGVGYCHVRIIACEFALRKVATHPLSFRIDLSKVATVPMGHCSTYN
jgi:hypothetical protein